jgi:hypothetical protein
MLGFVRQILGLERVLIFPHQSSRFFAASSWLARNDLLRSQPPGCSMGSPAFNYAGRSSDDGLDLADLGRRDQ